MAESEYHLPPISAKEYAEMYLGTKPERDIKYLEHLFKEYGRQFQFYHLTEAGKMIDNKVMLQRAYAWITMHYPNTEVLSLLPEVMASYMAKFAQEQIKSFQSNQQEEPK